MQDLPVQINVSAETYLKNPVTTDLGKKIIAESIVLIDKLGFEAFTFKKLGAVIGSPESTIYRYFENKHMLLVYLTNWYWSWMEYRLVFSTMNLPKPQHKLEIAIQILTEPIQEDVSFSHVNEVLLDKIIIKESAKIFYTKAIDEENKKGYFLVYKRLVQRVCDWITEIKTDYPYPHMLVSGIIEGAHQQRFFAKHLPSLTDINQEENACDFYRHLVFKVIME